MHTKRWKAAQTMSMTYQGGIMKLVGLEWRDVWGRKSEWGHKRGADYGVLPRTNKRVDIKYFLCARPSAERTWFQFLPFLSVRETWYIKRLKHPAVHLFSFFFASFPKTTLKTYFLTHENLYFICIPISLLSLGGRKC